METLTEPNADPTNSAAATTLCTTCSGGPIPASWFTKVGIAFLLIAHLVVDTLGGLGPLRLDLHALLAGQITVAVGGLMVIVHHAVLRSRAKSIANPTALVTSGGLFGVIRHPMYLGDFVVIAGLALMAPSWISVAVVPVAFMALLHLARHDDALMAERFPNDFEAYRQRTSRLVPYVL